MSEQAAPKDFFISYTKADLAWAEWIAKVLESKGFTTVYQHRDFPAAPTDPSRDLNFVRKMHEALEAARCTLALFSPDYLKSRFCGDEWTAAFHLHKLQPVKVRDCKIPGLLAPLAHVDLVNLIEDKALEALLSGLNIGPPVEEGGRFPGPSVSQPPEAPTVRFPGFLPPIWNLTHRRNPNFTGREELLEGLREALDSGEPAAVTQAIHGLGGVGKTALAVEYVYRYQPYYELVWWLRSEKPATLAADYAALAGPLKLPEKDASDQEAQVRAVRQCLGRLDQWLLIFDNAVQPDDIKDFIPLGGGGNSHVIITSRNPAWRGLAWPLEITVLPRQEAVAFLLQRTGQEDEAAAAALAEELGDLPLALEQAGAYMEGTIPFPEYLTLFQNRRAELWEEEKKPLDYPDTVATTWSLALDQVKAVPGASDLLRLCAFLAPDDIPLSLLKEGAENLPEPLKDIMADTLARPRALAALQRYSLLDVNTESDSVAVHRLVQAVVRDRLDGEAQKTWAGAAVELVNSAFPGDVTTNLESWPACARLLPHALAALARAGELHLTVAAAGRLGNQAGFYLKTRAELAQARACHEQALRIIEAVYGLEHPDVAACVNNLGLVLQEQGDLKRAKECYERALRVIEAVYGSEHPDVATFVNNLGGVLLAQGDLAGARECYERVLAICMKALGPDYPQVATGVNNLGEVLRAQGDLAGARECYERALAIWEKALGPDHPQVSIGVNNLGLVFQALGDLAGAKACFERSLRIDEAAYGPDHPTVAIRVNNLGDVVQDLGDLGSAKDCYERALAIWEKALGPEHPQVAIGVNNLGDVLRDLGDLGGAQDCFERALRIDEAAYGTDHPEVARDVNNLGMVLKAKGALAGAKACFERALEIEESAFGPEHPKVAIRVNNLGGVHRALGDLGGARECYERALRIDEVVYGLDHPAVARDANNLGSVLYGIGDLAGALECCERALRICIRFLGPNHPKTQTARENLEFLESKLQGKEG